VTELTRTYLTLHIVAAVINVFAYLWRSSLEDAPTVPAARAVAQLILIAVLGPLPWAYPIGAFTVQVIREFILEIRDRVQACRRKPAEESLNKISAIVNSRESIQYRKDNGLELFDTDPDAYVRQVRGDDR
jgi:hypothetical protein